LPIRGFEEHLVPPPHNSPRVFPGRASGADRQHCAVDLDVVADFDVVSARPEPYPYWHQNKYTAERIPLLPLVGN
jgi:hypothetical protein